jgi:hypothetical protein
VISEVEENMKTEKLKQLLVGVFEFWKSFPDAVRTFILVSVIGGLITVFWAGNQTPINQSPPVQPNTQQSAGKKQDSLPERSSRPVQFEQTRVASVLRANEAQETLERGSYAESYRQSLELLRSLPKPEQQRILTQSEAAARSYEKGDFREAAYRMQKALNSTHPERKE